MHTEKWKELKALLAQVHNLAQASAVLGWDQQTNMPPKGAASRAEQLAALDTLSHHLFTSDRIGALLEELAPEAEQMGYDSDEASLVRITKRDYDKACRVPDQLVEEISRASALGLAAWEEARPASNYTLFQPHLDKIIELEIQLAEHLGYQDRRYDALLDQYEPGMTAARVAQIFEPLKKELLPLVRAISERKESVDDACLHREYDERKQWDFGLDVIKRFGFDLQGGRQDKSAHPFTTSFGLGDVRITTRVDKRFLPTALFGTIHECGHALYEQGYCPELEYTPLAGGASLGVHESQSRLWENLVGRSRGFWRYFFPRLQAAFPDQLKDQNLESFYRAINQVCPSLIRVEADEVTYNLHIMLRFELENDLVERRVRVNELPEAWNAKIKEYLGITPPNHGQGVLQDVHWAQASVGYFPTYSLGTLLSVQLFNRAVEEVPEIPSQIEQGEFASLLGWLRTKVHAHGRKFTLTELAERATGQTLESGPFTQYLKSKYGEIYHI